jgi:hypothetical protein
VVCSYGITDRHGGDGAMRGLAENRRFLESGGRGLVGVHAAFTCSDEPLESAADLAEEFGVGIHIHVAEGTIDAGAAPRLAALSRDSWVLAHGVHLAEGAGVRGRVVHNPRSNLNNGVGYVRPARFPRVALGTDGIGADMLEEFRLAFALARAEDVTVSPEVVWRWLEGGYDIVPEARDDRVTWSYEPMEPWHLAYTTGVRPVEVIVDGRVVLADGAPTLVDPAEIRAKAAEQAKRLWARL